MKYIKTFEKYDLTDNSAYFMNFLVNFILSLDFNLTSNYNKIYKYHNEICFYSKTPSSTTFEFAIILGETYLKLSNIHDEFNIIEEYFETIDGLDLVKNEYNCIYTFSITAKHVDYIINQINKDDFDLIISSNKFNI
jgi:hypothetical protein